MSYGMIMSANAAQSCHGWAFSIYDFIMDFPEDMQACRTAPTLAGIDHILVAPPETCDNLRLTGDQRDG